MLLLESKNLEMFRNNISKSIIPLVKTGVMFELNGELGAGKTEFVKTVLLELLKDNTSLVEIFKSEFMSPTYNIINEYSVGSFKALHLDLYRIETCEELEEIGFYDLDFKNSLSFIEWPKFYSANTLSIHDVIKCNFFKCNEAYHLKVV